MDDSTRQDLYCVLPNGRRLGYAIYGDTEGTPLLFFPGILSSRWHRPMDEDWLRQRRIRFITVERPGYGISDFQVGRRLVDWPKDVECLCEALRLDRVYVAGSSAGGPHVAACSALLSQRIIRAAIVAGGGPLSAPGAMTNMAYSRRFFAEISRRAPGVFESILGHLPLHRRADLVYGWMARALRPDRDTLDTYLEERLPDVAEALRPGMRGFAREVSILSGEWGFRLEDIPIDVDVWHGSADESTPIGMAEHVASRIPHAQRYFVEGGGHLLIRTHGKAIIERLIAVAVDGTRAVDPALT
jgi:pimeloyl-ACP methyl ester carboxylesterase